MPLASTMRHFLFTNNSFKEFPIFDQLCCTMAWFFINFTCRKRSFLLTSKNNWSFACKHTIKSSIFVL
jgi:hypothetical protein